MDKSSYVGRIYVKMPVYVQQWLRTKYQSLSSAGEPVEIPWLGNAAGRVVYTCLVPNEYMKKLTPTCYSDEMFSKNLDDVPPEFVSRFPTDESRQYFCAIALPKPHFFRGRFISDDCYWQLGKEDTKKFTRLLEKEFWDDLVTFWQDWKRNFLIQHPGMRPSLWDAVLDFLDMYCINPDVMDSLYRQISRKKDEIKMLN